MEEEPSLEYMRVTPDPCDFGLKLYDELQVTQNQHFDCEMGM